jgi:hypothetical protein
MVDDTIMLDFFDALVKEIERTSDFCMCLDKQVFQDILCILYGDMFADDNATCDADEAVFYNDEIPCYLFLEIFNTDEGVIIDIFLHNQNTINNGGIAHLEMVQMYTDSFFVDECDSVKSVAVKVLTIVEQIKRELYYTR